MLHGEVVMDSRTVIFVQYQFESFYLIFCHMLFLVDLMIIMQAYLSERTQIELVTLNHCLFSQNF